MTKHILIGYCRIPQKERFIIADKANQILDLNIYFNEVNNEQEIYNRTKIKKAKLNYVQGWLAGYLYSHGHPFESAK